MEFIQAPKLDLSSSDNLLAFVSKKRNMSYASFHRRQRAARWISPNVTPLRPVSGQFYACTRGIDRYARARRFLPAMKFSLDYRGFARGSYLMDSWAWKKSHHWAWLLRRYDDNNWVCVPMERNVLRRFFEMDKFNSLQRSWRMLMAFVEYDFVSCVTASLDRRYSYRNICVMNILDFWSFVFVIHANVLNNRFWTGKFIGESTSRE